MNNLSGLGDAVKQVDSVCGDNGLNLLVNNAGVFKMEKFEDVTEEGLRSTFQVNCIGPFVTTQKFLPLIRKAAKAAPGDTLSVARAAVVNLASDSGSIGFGFDVAPQPHLPYRMSKSAVNMMTSNLAFELKPEGILVACIHPGFVKTPMGLEWAQVAGLAADDDATGFISPETSALAMIGVITKLGTEDTGKFVDYEGKGWPW